MPPTLRVVLDQLVTTTDPQLAIVERELGRALVATAPSGCVVAGIAPAGAVDPGEVVPGLAEVHRTVLQRRELAAAWQLGVAPGVGGGMIHAASLMAPLVRHDRVYDNDQTVVTLWDLDAWEHPERMPRPAVMWHRAMLKRAEKHADAIVVPTHAMARRLSEIGAAGHRVRVIEGAAPEGFATPTDAVGRLRTLEVPEHALVVVGAAGAAEAFRAVAISGLDAPVVVLDAEGAGPVGAVADAAAAARIPAERVSVRGMLDDADRAAVLGSALAVVAPDVSSAFPWRVVEAMAVGAPVVAAASPVHAEIVLDGGAVAAGVDAMAEGLVEAVEGVARARVLSGDRGRAFSWRNAAERVWQLHADL